MVGSDAQQDLRNLRQSSFRKTINISDKENASFGNFYVILVQDCDLLLYQYYLFLKDD